MTLLNVYILLCLYLVTNISAKPNGLTLELMSQYTTLNLSSEQQFLQQNNVVRSQLERQEDYLFMVKIRIGKIPNQKPQYMEYFLHIDTSSPLTWLQCQGCKKCFKQSEDLFPKNSSKSFHPIPPSDKLCLTKQSNGKYCSYNIRYDDKSYTSGILARENFSLYSPKFKKYTNLDNIVFGCGMVQNRIVYGKSANNAIAGALGLGRGPNSFLTQIESIAHGKFSYCFPSPATKMRCSKCKSHLRFGANADSPKRNIQKITKLHQVEGSPFYYVELEGISVNDQRLKIDANVFRVQENNTGGGVIINSGVMLSQLIRPAYDVLEQGLDSAFEKLNASKATNGQERTCYWFKPGKAKKYSGVPTITYHLKGGAHLIIKADALFTIFSYDPDRAIICLGIYPNDKMTVIGANQQVNHWFTFDTNNNQLFFHPYNC